MSRLLYCITLTIVSQAQFVYLINANQLTSRVESSHTDSRESNGCLVDQPAEILFQTHRFASPPKVYHDIFTEKQMDIMYEFFTRMDQFHGNYTLAELSMVALTAKFHSLTTGDQPKHRYDSFSDLKNSFGPHIDNEDCLRQLVEWNQRAESMRRQKFRTRDLNLYRLLDSYGKVSAGMVANSASWTGMYEICLGLKIDSAGHLTSTRYCLASMKLKHLPIDFLPYNQLFAAEVGVCLPKSCDPLPHRNKFDLILKLIEFNWRDMEKGQATLESLYCLPDEDSRLRMWWKSPWVKLAIVLVGTWLAVLIYATLKYELQLRSGGTIEVGSSSQLKYYQILSVTHNIRLLFNICKNSKSKPVDKLVDFSCLDGIKVITMLITILAHVLILASDPLFNRTDVIMLDLLMIACLCQNIFFTLSGVLNCYSQFKQSQISPGKPKNAIQHWVASILTRYLRIMPMYAIHVYYIKYLLKFTGSGPRWDYGTSSLGLKRQCENESWLWTLLFGANFKPILEHCISNAWYLANDFQFFLVTPLFLFLLYKWPSIGRTFLKICMAASCLAGISTMLLADAPDMRPSTRPMPHSFTHQMAYQSPSYTMPQFRISAYLCGLLVGYKLCTYEQAKRKYLNVVAAKEKDNDNEMRSIEFKYWPDWLIKNGCRFRWANVILYSFLLILSSLHEVNKPDAKLSAGLYLPINHLLVALALGSYILTATTGSGSKFIRQFLAAPFWKPLAKLSLCVSLINIEFIRYMDQSPKEQNYLHRWNLVGQMVLTLLGSYFGATLTHLVFEAPISGLLHHLHP